VIARAEENRGASLAEPFSFFRVWSAGPIDRPSADLAVDVVEVRTDSLQHAQRLGGYLGPDAVAAQHRDRRHVARLGPPVREPRAERAFARRTISSMGSKGPRSGARSQADRSPARRVMLVGDDANAALDGDDESIVDDERIVDDQRIVSPRAQFEEEVVGASLRPRSFDEYVGQTQVVENLRIAIDAARRRDEPLEHVLFYGPPGLGKTTLASLIAKEMGAALRPTSGPTLEKPKDLVGILTALEPSDVLFIDEIHRLGSVVEEYLYPAMEEFRIDLVMDRGAYAKTFRLPLSQFTLVGATTRAGMLSAPLRERFGIIHHLDYYDDAELERIVVRSAGVLGITIEPAGAATIARRSRGTPRIANRLLRRVRDYAEVRADGVITEPVADEALRREGVDERGLDRLDRAFLSTLIEQYRGGPAGIGAIAATLTEDAETLEDVVEPYLLKIGFVQRTASGRKATAAAFAHLGVVSPRSAQQRLL